jgi:NAD(P)-dependent dehydrogenase (short-subunit alcohol dehydrogenase family)
MEIDLSGETAIVTGSGRGIGETIAETFAEAGANIVVVARTRSEIEAVADHLEETYGVDTLPVPTDMAEVSDIDALIDETLAEFGPPSILVNNAAANLGNSPLTQPLEDIDQMLDVNLRGVFLLSQRFGLAFRESDLDTGRIINISSISAQRAIPTMTLYGGTKSALYGITKGLAAELGPDGVRVNTITPGTIKVQRIRDLIDEKGEEIYDFDRLPLGRLGEPEDVASLCTFLASDQAEYITGEDIRVDGGVGFTAGAYK